MRQEIIGPNGIGKDDGDEPMLVAQPKLCGLLKEVLADIQHSASSIPTSLNFCCDLPIKPNPDKGSQRFLEEILTQLNRSSQPSQPSPFPTTTRQENGTIDTSGVLKLTLKGGPVWVVVTFSTQIGPPSPNPE